MNGFKSKKILSKLQKVFTLLLALPLCAGLFSGVVEAAVYKECNSKESCEEELKTFQEIYDEAVVLHEAFLDCWKKCGNCECGYTYDEDEPDYYCKALWWDYTTDKRENEERCTYVYNEAIEQSEDLGLTKLKDTAEYLGKVRQETGSVTTKLKIYLNSLKAVDARNILNISGQKHFTDAKEFLGKVIDLLVKMVGLVALVFLVIGGFRLVVAAGNDNEIQKAKTMITYSIIGLVVTLLAYLIVAFVQGILYRQ